MYAPNPTAPPPRRASFGAAPLPRKVVATLVKVNGKIVMPRAPGTRLFVPGMVSDDVLAILDAFPLHMQQEHFGADAPPSTVAKTTGQILGGLLGAGIGAKIGGMLGGLIKGSKNPQRIQQAQQMAVAVAGGNLSAMRRLRERAGQFATDDAGFTPAIRLLQQNGVIDSSDRFLLAIPWTEEGHAEMFDGPPLFSTTRPAGAVDHPELFAGQYVPAPNATLPVLISAPNITPFVGPMPPNAPIAPNAPPVVNTPQGSMTPEQIKAMVLNLQGAGAVVPTWATQMLAVLQGGGAPSAPAAPMPVMAPTTSPITASIFGGGSTMPLLIGGGLLLAVVLGGKRRTNPRRRRR